MRPYRCDSIKGAHLPPRGKPPPETEMNRSPFKYKKRSA
ncbi:hypothetical protein KR50_31590 [Jeotgalibacillus campisalis]|uniref:Uncharacterized protein n=1 Tax=Jeotgalibacillus campisalis TaxID=220754 RepID=A0A0C2RPG6_9BACL|nr:hypothetical protein KR50_31590 [Jeotgalibacillus campisalis]